MHGMRLTLLGAVCALTIGCAKPNYEMISAMHDSQVRSNAQIAEALASMSNTQAEFIFSEATTLPAGTVIRTYYDFSHAFKFNEAENPGVKIFQAEAARDSVVTGSIIGGVTTAIGIGFGADLLKSAIKHAGETHLENSGDGSFTLSGGMGDRDVYGTGGITDSMDLSDHTATPTVVTPATSSSGTITQQGSTGWSVAP